MSAPILTVVDPATDFTLCSLADVKAELDITGRSSDVLLRRYIRNASARIAVHCNRVFALETVSETFRLGNWSEKIALERQPVVSIGSVTVSGEVMDPSTYEVDPDTGHLYRLAADNSCRLGWLASSTAIVVVYDAGYVLPDAAPDGLQEACIALVRARWFARKRDPSLKVEDLDGVQRNEFWVGSTGDAMPTEVEQLLKPFCRPNR